MSLAALLILPVTASGSQILTVLEQDVLVAGPFLPRRHLTKETICFNETGSHSETPFFFCVLGRKSSRNLVNGLTLKNLIPRLQDGT